MKLQFTLKRLLLATALIAAGVSSLMSGRVDWLNPGVALLLWCLSAPLVTIGVCSLHQSQPDAVIIGALVGVGIQFFLAVALNGTVFQIPFFT